MGPAGSRGAAILKLQMALLWDLQLELGREVYLGIRVASPWAISLPISFKVQCAIE